MAFIPDRAIDEGYKLTPSARQLYYWLCRKRNHETQRAEVTKQQAQDALKLKQSQTFAAFKELQEANWIDVLSEGCSLLFGDFSPVNKHSEKSELTGNVIPKNRNLGTNRYEKSENSKKSEYQNSEISESHIKEFLPAQEESLSVTHVPEREAQSTKSSEKAKATKARNAIPNAQDELNAWLASLEQNPAYEGINVRILFNKMLIWCETKGKAATKLRFVNWLNREEKPINGVNGNGQIRQDSKPSKQAIERAKLRQWQQQQFEQITRVETGESDGVPDASFGNDREVFDFGKSAF